MSNKWSKRRSNPGTPKICRTKPRPIPWILPISPWPVEFLCLSGVCTHQNPPFEAIPFAVTVGKLLGMDRWEGNHTADGFWLTARIDSAGPPFHAHYRFEWYQGTDPQAAIEGDTGPLPLQAPWTITATAATLWGDWIASHVFLSYGACPSS